MMEIGKVVPQLLRDFDIEWASEKEDWEFTVWWFARQKGLIAKLTRRDWAPLATYRFDFIFHYPGVAPLRSMQAVTMYDNKEKNCGSSLDENSFADEWALPFRQWVYDNVNPGEVVYSGMWCIIRRTSLGPTEGFIVMN
jgi:hypothetical protein